jgi:hypothetical protein
VQAERLVAQQPSRSPAVARAGWVVAGAPQSLDPQEAHAMPVLLLLLLLLLLLAHPAPPQTRLA